MLTQDQLKQQCLTWCRDGGWSAAFNSVVPVRRTLATLHDTLLSGELSVASAAKITEAAA